MNKLLPVLLFPLGLLWIHCEDPDPNPEFANLEPAKPAVRQADTLIRVNGPVALDTLYSPIRFTGEARGFYYFEADFPVSLETATGSVIGRGIATALGPWMTTGWVPYEGRMEFEVRDPQMAYLVFQRANPSGEVANAFSYKHPVVLAPGSGEATLPDN